MELLFSKAELTDTQKLIELHEVCFAGDADLFGRDAWTDYFYTTENIINAINNHIVYKIMDGEKIIGDILIKVCKNHEYYIWLFCITPEYQNRGIGTETLRFLENTFTDARIFTLVTPKQKSKNCYFYEKNGFKRVFEEVVSDRYTRIGYLKNINQVLTTQ